MRSRPARRRQPSTALVVGTSGSTATSKLVVQSHANLAVNAEAVRGTTACPWPVLLGCLPIHHVNGLYVTVLRSLASRSHAILTDSFDPFRYSRLVEDHRPSVASVVPSILESLRYVWHRPWLPTELSHFTSAAAPLAEPRSVRYTPRWNVRSSRATA